jgi:hypothetical protein
MSIQHSSLQLLMELLKKTSGAISKLREQPQIYMIIWRKLSLAILGDASVKHPDVAEHFLKTWLDVYDDVRWFFLRAAA